MKFNLWVEGYAATGEHGTAKLLGTVEAESFNEAVLKWNSENNTDGRKWGNLGYDLNYDRHSLWGCRIYDNERDARKAFG